MTYRTPVIMLSDGYLGNGAEPWQVPDLAEIPRIDPNFATEPNTTTADGSPRFMPYRRDPQTLARPWALPGTKGLEHRIGGLEKSARTGAISYDPSNHEEMVATRAAKVKGIAKTVPPTTVDDPSGDADVLVLGWGSTYGPITAAVRRVRAHGLSIAQAHVRHLNPLPEDLGDVLHRYRRVVVPEMNTGQFAMLLRSSTSSTSRRSRGCAGYQSRRWTYAMSCVASVVARVATKRRRPEMTDITIEDLPAGLAGVPLAIEPLKRRDFASDQEVRWCPGCGDYAILSTFQGVLPDLGIAKENAVVISGIGCSSRFPYYMNTYGMHSIHGRAPVVATGWPYRAPTWPCSSLPVTATPCRLGVITSSTPCDATST